MSADVRTTTSSRSWWWPVFAVRNVGHFLTVKDYRSFLLSDSLLYSMALRELTFIFKNTVPNSFKQRLYKQVELFECVLAEFAPTLTSLTYNNASTLMHTNIPTSLDTFILRTSHALRQSLKWLPVRLRVFEYAENTSYTEPLRLTPGRPQWPVTLTSLSIKAYHIILSEACFPPSLRFLSLKCGTVGPHSYCYLKELQTLELRSHDHHNHFITFPCGLKKLLCYCFNAGCLPGCCVCVWKESECQNLPEFLQELDICGEISFTLPSHLTKLACTDYTCQNMPLPLSLVDLKLRCGASQVRSVEYLTNLTNLNWQPQDYKVPTTLPSSVSKLTTSFRHLSQLYGAQVTHIHVLDETRTEFLGNISNIRTKNTSLDSLSFQWECSLDSLLLRLGFPRKDGHTVFFREPKVDYIQTAILGHYACVSCEKQTSFKLLCQEDIKQIQEHVCYTCYNARCDLCSKNCDKSRLCRQCLLD